MGAHKRPSYRFVVADQRAPRDGRFIETLGYYNPLTDPATIKVNEERAIYWLNIGARPSQTAESLLRKVGVLDRWTAMKSGQALDTATATTAQTTTTEAAASTGAPAPAPASSVVPSAPAGPDEAPVAVGEPLNPT